MIFNRLKSLKICFILLVVLYLASFYYNINFVNNEKPVAYQRKCNFEMAKDILENLCDYYLNRNLIIGNMCSSICDPKNHFKFFDNYKLAGCFNNELIPRSEEDDYEFKTVLVYEITDQKYVSNKMPERLVLKSSHKYFSDFDRHSGIDFSPNSIKEGLTFLVENIKQTLYSNYGIETDPALTSWADHYLKKNITIKESRSNNIKDIFYYLRLLSGNSYHEFVTALKNNNHELLTIFIDNLSTLLNQEEYLFSRYFGNRKHTLNIYGTCGHFYAVEFAESLGSQVSLMNLNNRMNLAHEFTDLIQNFDTKYLANEIAARDVINNSMIALQICDVKLDNFGLTSKGELKVIDTDMIHPDSYLFRPKVCDKHDDCHFFDCSSYCDFKTNKCGLNRLNNNLQSICEKIFYNKYFKEDALIGEYDKDDGVLKLLLRKCADPGNFTGTNIRIKASNEMLLRIREQLKLLMQQNESSEPKK